MSASPDPVQSSGPHSADEPDGSRPRLPESIVIASELWIVVILAHIVTLVATYDQQRAQYLDMVEGMVKDATAEQRDLITSSGLFIGSLVVGALIQFGVAIVLILLTRRGYNWARFLIGAISMYLVITTFFTLFADVSPAWAMVPTVIGGVAALGAVVLFLRRESDTYCKNMATFRRESKRPKEPPLPSMVYPGGQYPGYPAHPGQNPYPTQNPYPSAPPPGQYPDAGRYPPAPDANRPTSPPSGGYPSMPSAPAESQYPPATNSDDEAGDDDPNRQHPGGKSSEQA
ncbi:hypothetical protein GYA93_09670 [Gordonia desulfuricans]|uniref:Uncharacterized protein n=1 Tax=Gordonia desulfuricans TaxID=89051 RepID=A0A7K3LNL6_9ACTN|nr:hypothetical protein [Gordonia desulfuricans]NDK89844.1 hypothetical protein [Gordonia desulfuricans]